MAQRSLQLINGRITEVEASVVSTGVADAGKLPALDPSGRLDQSMMPVGIGADVQVLPSSENLTAGDYVNIWNDSGTARVRKADASFAGAGKRAHGFVKENVTAPANATVYFEGSNDSLTSLTPGTTYVLSHTTPGGVVALASATTTAGHILQVIGESTSDTIINTEIQQPIVRG